MFCRITKLIFLKKNQEIMIHHIQQENFSAQISELGAELISFKNEETKFEYIWNGNPEIWNGRAPLLFPNIGKLKNDEYLFNGKIYKMEKHGFARKSHFDLIDKTESSASFKLKYSEETLKFYPFKFELEVLFEINNGNLKVTNTVRNIGNEAIFFTIGLHPAFSLPLENSTLNDYFIELDKKEELQLFEVEDGFIKRDSKNFILSSENRIQLSADIFNDDALIFKNINSREISIGNIKSDYKVKLISNANLPHLGIWAKPNAPFVCIEPWLGHADFTDSNKTFIEKDNTVKLNIGEEFETGYEIIV